MGALCWRRWSFILASPNFPCKRASLARGAGSGDSQLPRKSQAPGKVPGSSQVTQSTCAVHGTTCQNAHGLCPAGSATTLSTKHLRGALKLGPVEHKKAVVPQGAAALTFSYQLRADGTHSLFPSLRLAGHWVPAMTDSYCADPGWRCSAMAEQDGGQVTSGSVCPF